MKMRYLFLLLILTLNFGQGLFSQSIHQFDNTKWKGHYYCSQGKTNFELEFEVSNNKLIAYFIFNYSNRVHGEYTLTGEYNPDSRKLNLTPKKWIKKPSGYGMVGMSGYVSDDGTLYNGKISSPKCGKFELRKEDFNDSDFAFQKVNNKDNETIFLGDSLRKMAEQKAMEEKERNVAIQKERELKIKSASNKFSWQLGDRICSKNFDTGTIEGVLDQWNEDKSKAKLKIIGSPGGSYKGEALTKGNLIWIDPADWYKCIGDENANYDISASGGGNISANAAQQQGSKNDVRKFAIGFGKQMMYKCHVEESPRNLDIDITKWEYFTKEDGFSYNGYMVRMKIWWIENISIFATKRTVDGCMVVDEFGCSPIFFVFSENIPSLFGGCFSNAGSGKGMKDEIVEFCEGKDTSKYYGGKCIND
jgi:hypothetical protein